MLWQEEKNGQISFVPRKQLCDRNVSWQKNCDNKKVSKKCVYLKKKYWISDKTPYMTKLK